MRRIEVDKGKPEEFKDVINQKSKIPEEIKHDFKDYIEASRKNEDKKKLEIRTDVSKRLLVVADSLTRMTGSDSEQTCEIMRNHSDNIRKNIEVIYYQLLTASGIAPIEPGAGDKFDEKRHIAVGLEYDTKFPQNSIFRIVRKGYLFENNVIRPAEVIVFKYPVGQKMIKPGFWDRLIGMIKKKNR
jgi:molecular chaperone GrpE